MKEVRRNYFVKIINDDGEEIYGYLSKKEYEKCVKRNVNIELKFKLINR